MKHYAGFLILHTILVALVFAAWRTGILVEFYATDTYYLATGMTCYFLYGIYNVLRGRWERVEQIITDLPNYGILFTMIGFAIALAGVLEGVEEAKAAGLHIAINTTIVGMAGAQWLRECERRLYMAWLR